MFKVKYVKIKLLKIEILVVYHFVQWTPSENYFATDSRNFNFFLEFFRVSVASFSVLIAAIFKLSHSEIFLLAGPVLLLVLQWLFFRGVTIDVHFHDTMILIPV